MATGPGLRPSMEIYFVKIIWTIHAEDRQREWERMKGLTLEVVQNVVRRPDQVVPGDLSVLIAQSQ